VFILFHQQKAIKDKAHSDSVRLHKNTGT